MRIKETRIYRFDELSDDAKKFAIEKQVESLHQDEFLSESIKEDLIYHAQENYAIDLSLLALEFSLSCCQGDGVAFYGNLNSEEIIKIINKVHYTDLSFEDHSLEIMERFPEIEVNIERNSYGNHYSHWNTMNVGMNCESLESSGLDFIESLQEYTETFESELKTLIQHISRELETIGYEAIDSYTSEESAKDTIDANDCEFTEDGAMA